MTQNSQQTYYRNTYMQSNYLITNISSALMQQSTNNNAIQNAPPPAYNELNDSNGNNSNKEQIFRDVINRYEINTYFSTKLQMLFSFKIVFVFDDSGSMCAVLNNSPLNTSVFKATRWDELKEFAKISVEIANIFNENGSDVHFLNRPPARNVQNWADLAPYFINRPNGFTPLTRVMTNVLNENNTFTLNERKLLVIIVTDGEPTTDNGTSDINNFKLCMQNRKNNVYTTVVSCTDEDFTMEYLNDWDRIIPRLDVVDDFRNERTEIQRTKGSHFRFSFGDYVVKSLIGSIDRSMDSMDERAHVVNSSECCNIV